MLERQHLTILAEVARSGSVTAAAARLNLSQSALSHTIRRFEEFHGVEVWTKNGRGLKLTAAGAHLLALATSVLPQFDRAERFLADFARGSRGLLRIGMECHPCEKWLMRIVTPFLEGWPDIEVDVKTGFRFDGITALRNHETDLLITPDPIEDPDIVFRAVFDYELVLVVSARHQLADHRFVQPRDLVGEVLMTVPVTLDRLDIYTRFFMPAMARPGVHRTVETTELMLRLAAAGRGVTVLPDWLVKEEGRELPLRMLRIGPEGMTKSIHLGVRRGEEALPHMQAFMTLSGWSLGG